MHQLANVSHTVKKILGKLWEIINGWETVPYKGQELKGIGLEYRQVLKCVNIQNWLNSGIDKDWGSKIYHALLQR